MKQSTWSQVLVWFGAGVSIAEILTGTLYAGLGFEQGLWAILLGHLIGGALMYLCGLIGGKSGLGAMETVGLSFGKKGQKLFAFLNVLQLVGWTAIMIYDGALSAHEICSAGLWVWALVIGGLLIFWVKIGLGSLEKVNTLAMGMLFVLSLILAHVVFGGDKTAAMGDGSMSFGAGVELAVAMPLSWLPLISDYTRDAEKPKQACWASVLCYNLVSVFMYLIGMGAALFTGESDIAKIMVGAGFGVAGLLIIVFSTVTTAFLDVWSCGLSAKALSEKVDEKSTAIWVTVIGILAAIFLKPADITDFLYLIGSVFAPMAAVQITDFFILKKAPVKEEISWSAMGCWAAGFAIYRLLMHLGSTPVVGITCLDMLATLGITWIFNREK